MNNNKYSFVLDNFRWSYSRLNSYITCPRMFFLQYIKEEESINNAFAEFGSFGHLILEKYLKKELAIFDLSKFYEENFDKEVRIPFPPNKYKDLRESYYEAGQRYFEEFEGFIGEPVWIEKSNEFKIEDYNFVGVVDLLLKDEEGDLHMVDHKSKSKFKNKNPLKGELNEYLKQLYLYSIPVFNEFKKYPKTLNFNMFKENDWTKVDFDMNEFENAKKWAVETIEAIKNDVEFKTKSNMFFCDFICSNSPLCKMSNNYIGG